MEKDNKKALYEAIMTSVAKEVKKVLNEKQSQIMSISYLNINGENVSKDFHNFWSKLYYDGKAPDVIRTTDKLKEILNLFLLQNYNTTLLDLQIGKQEVPGHELHIKVKPDNINIVGFVSFSTLTENKGSISTHIKKALNESRSDDGWDEGELYDLIEVLDDIYNVSYEIKNCVRGAYTGAETWSALADYIEDLAEKLNELAEYIREIPEPEPEEEDDYDETDYNETEE